MMMNPRRDIARKRAMIDIIATETMIAETIATRLLTTRINTVAASQTPGLVTYVKVILEQVGTLREMMTE
jgi:hypothetical protein